MKTKHIIFLFLLILIGYGCAQNEKTKYDEVYLIIDELLRYNYYDADLVVLKLKENKEYFVDMKFIYNDVDSISELMSPLPPPPSLVNTSYYKYFFTQLYNLNLIDSLDVDYMYNQLNSKETYTLDSTKIERKAITQIDFKELKGKYGTDDFYQIIKHQYNAYSYIVLSVPIISIDQKKILMEIEYHCGYLCGSCNQYLFEKIEGKWKIKYITGKWIS